MESRPNILYFVCHDLGRALGCYGAGIPTPHLDSFAREGVRFSNAHCASPACSPSRACAMSGMYAHTSGALGLSHMGWPLDLRWTTTVDDFHAAGYQTILSGINHERHPLTDRYSLDLNRDWDDWKLPRVVERALDALDRRDSARPFYLNIASQEPHSCTWGDVGSRIPPMQEDWPGWMPPGMPRTPALEAAFRRFAAAVVHLDTSFGMLMDGLERLGLSENTLVVFTTDHGMAGPRGKGGLYGLGTEIALLMKWQDVLSAGGLRHLPVSNISFRATLAEAAGIPQVAERQGRSIWEYAQTGKAPADDAIYLERNFHGERPWRTEPDYVDTFDPLRAVRTQRYLYIKNFLPGAKPAEPLVATPGPAASSWQDWGTSWELPLEKRPDEELYDAASDPLEMRNLAGEPYMQSVRNTLSDQLENWMRETSDFLPADPPPRPEAPGWGPHWTT